jgi:hypothetical protein
MTENANRIKNAKNIKEIQFVALESNAPLFTVTGENVDFFLENSELIQTILELSKDRPSKEVLVVPIGEMPMARRLLLIDILQGKPIGRRLLDNTIEYYPLHELEERNIQNAVNRKLAEINGEVSNVTRHNLQENERMEAILNTMRYLLIPDELIEQMLVFDEEAFPQEEKSFDEYIENLVEIYKKYLFLIGRKDLLTGKDEAELQEYYDAKRSYFAMEKDRLHDLQEEVMKKYYKSMRSRGTSSRNSNNYDEPPDRYEEELEQLYDEERDIFDPGMHIPKGLKGYGTSKLLDPVAYEKYLRTDYFKPKNNRRKPKGIPGEIHLNTLFNETERAKKSRWNEQNDSAVIFYNPNRPATKTRKNNKGKKGNNKNKEKNRNQTKGRGNSNGSAF